MELTKEQIESLAKFALDILNEFPEMGDFDGGDIQDIAITRNLLVPQIVHAPCAEEDCNCAQFYDDADFTAGVTCYHIADWLDRVAEQRDAPVHAEQAGTCSCPRSDTGTILYYDNNCVEHHLPSQPNRSAGG